MELSALSMFFVELLVNHGDFTALPIFGEETGKMEVPLSRNKDDPAGNLPKGIVGCEVHNPRFHSIEHKTLGGKWALFQRGTPSRSSNPAFAVQFVFHRVHGHSLGLFRLTSKFLPT